MERLNLSFSIGLLVLISIITAACAHIVFRKYQLFRKGYPLDATFSFAIGLFVWTLGIFATRAIGARYRYCEYLGYTDCGAILSSPWVPFFVTLIGFGGLWHLYSLTRAYNERIWLYAAALASISIAATYYALGL